MPRPRYDFLGWGLPSFKDIAKLIKLLPQSIIYSGKITPLFKAPPGDSLGAGLQLNFGGDIAIYNQFVPPFVTFDPEVPGEEILAVFGTTVKCDIWPEGDEDEVPGDLSSLDVLARKKWRDLVVEPQISYQPFGGIPSFVPGSKGIFMVGYFTERNWYDREIMIRNSPTLGQNFAFLQGGSRLSKDEYFKLTWQGSFRNNTATNPDFSTAIKRQRFEDAFQPYTTWEFDSWHPETFVPNAIGPDAEVVQPFLDNFGQLVKITPTKISALVYTSAFTVLYTINGVLQFPRVFFGYTPVQYDWEYQKKRYEFIKNLERGKQF